MPSEKHNRREFLRDIGRLALLGAVTLLGATLARRRLNVKRARETCVHDGYCPDCPALSGCILPPAQSMKKAMGRERSNG
jgi:hypothetical protein